MGTVMDYMQWRGDRGFTQDPFNDIDALILSMLSYMPFKDIVPGVDSKKRITLKDVANQYFSENPAVKEKPSNINLTVSSTMDAELVELLKVGAHSQRFGNMQLSRYEEKMDFTAAQQFAAVMYSLPNTKREKVIAFRGTDNTLIGWKEDLQMAYMEQIPAQESAARYLKRNIDILSGKVTICGHSKGGNLAVYAASRLKGLDRLRISRILNFDGPGLNHSNQSRTSLSYFEDKMVNYVPEESIVGLLLEHVGKRRVIASSAWGVYQHNPITWQVQRTEFISGNLSDTTKLLEDTLEKWLADLSLDRRKAFIDALFEVLGASEGKTVGPKDNLKDLNNVIKNYANLDEETKKILSEVFSSITRQAKNTISETIKEKLSFDK